jgi:hypothetical protein
MFEEGSQPRLLRQYIGRRKSWWRGENTIRVEVLDGSPSIIGICFPRIDMSFAVLIMLICLSVEMVTHCVGERVPFFGGGLFG